MIVLDASAAVSLLLRQAPVPIRAAVAAHTRRAAPALIDLEVLSVLRRLARRRELDDERIGPLMDALALTIRRPHPLRPLIGRARELTASISPYDAVYVALAEALEAPLVTLDLRLARAVRALATAPVIAPD